MIYRQELSLAQCFHGARYLPDNEDQRYDWSAEQVTRMVQNLISNFLWFHEPYHEKKDWKEYPSSRIGSISLRTVRDDRSFLNGHQLFITLALLLICIHNQQGSRPDRVKLDTLLSYEDLGEWAVNPDFGIYGSFLYDLFQGLKMEPWQVPANVRNLVARYQDIETCLRDGIDDRALPIFAAWLIRRPYLEVITAKCATGASLLQSAHAYDRLMAEKRKEMFFPHDSSLRAGEDSSSLPAGALCN